MQSSLYQQFLKVSNSSGRIELWNRCGTLEKFVIDSKYYVAKISKVPDDLQHKHIEQTDFALTRKVRSYQKEQLFYKRYVGMLSQISLAPQVYDLHHERGTFVTLLEDFEAIGFHNKKAAQPSEIKQILNWLAGFHAIWLEAAENHSMHDEFGEGNYWHLKTRPDELEKMPSCQLKQQAKKIDEALGAAKFRTLIHGDAKLANFAFKKDAVIGYDFQHVGVGIGLADVMLLFTTVLENDELERYCESLLDYYFQALAEKMNKLNIQIQPSQVETEWRPLWPILWADFHRFLAGWKPDHKKINRFMKTQSNKLRVLL
ncbi:phosphotransferase [Pseudoalteromonas luteoviolacea]|uniref:phosphotransferase n=1 Tax=Pseudoalteromonas luteoviolacea TaxID=43657 RepID=UPI0011522BB9|nr:phosphotransferase [Pseudoalteromonas luteoviolacea]TQF67465.1 phosphotransferase [Pseudoalteromonas luteoviolacea]